LVRDIQTFRLRPKRVSTVPPASSTVANNTPAPTCAPVEANRPFEVDPALAAGSAAVAKLMSLTLVQPLPVEVTGPEPSEPSAIVWLKLPDELVVVCAEPPDFTPIETAESAAKPVPFTTTVLRSDDSWTEVLHPELGG
jgi:hypothetical protein